MKDIPFLLLTLIGLGFAGAIQAQSIQSQVETSQRDSTLDRLDATLRQSPSSGSGSITQSSDFDALPGEEEYGEQKVLIRQTNWEPWTIAFDTTFAYTDNVTLGDEIVADDTYLRTGMRINYTPHLKGNLFADFGVRQHLYFYNRFPEMNFDQFVADAGLMYVVPQLWDTTFFTRYSYYRLTDGTLGDEIFTHHTVTLGAQKAFRFSRGHQMVIGASSEISLDAEPFGPRRHEHSLYVGYSIEWLEGLFTNFTYRGSYNDYHLNHRQDWNHTAMAAVVWRPTQWFEAGTHVSYVYNQSNYETFHYQNWQTMLGLSFSLKF